MKEAWIALGLLGAALMWWSYRPASKPSIEMPDVPAFADFHTREYSEAAAYYSWIPGMVEHKMWRLFLYNEERISEVERQWREEDYFPWWARK